MTATEQTIQDGIEGGWKEDELSSCTNAFIHENANNGDKNCYVIDNSYTSHVTGERHNIAKHYSIGDIVTDPAFWQAVGKVRGWCKGDYSQPEGMCDDCGEVGGRCKSYRDYMMHFMSEIADGMTIEEALTAIA